jgi:RNA recognition motif-containing protein
MAAKCASKTLFVGNLHASLEETDLLEIFKPFGRIVECCKRWCHYGFIQFATEDEAKLAFNNLNGSRVRGRPMRIEFQRKKIRNLAALLEAEAQSKNHLEDRTSPLMRMMYDMENTENISPESTGYQNFYKQMDNFSFAQATQHDRPNQHPTTDDIEKFKFTFHAYNSTQEDGLMQLNSTNETQILVSQFSFIDTLCMQPLANRDLNIKIQQPMQRKESFDDLTDDSIAKEIANSVLLSSAKKPTSKQQQPQQAVASSNEVMDKKSTAWFNYLLDKAAQYPNTRGIYKSNDNASSHSISSSCTSSSPRSPINHCQASPSVKNSSASACEASIVLYRSLNTSNTIFVQPTDILEPLEVGEFNEYKLFPQTTTKEELYSFQMSSPKRPNAKETSLDMLVELTPPSSVSLSPSCSSSSSSSSSFRASNTSPIRSPTSSMNVRIITKKNCLATQKLFSEH